MISSLLKILGLEKEPNSTMLVLHNGFVIVAQVQKNNNEIDLIGYNESELEEGILKDGQIYDPDAFQEILKKLLEEAKPNAIKTKSILINIPLELLYPFLKDFSSKTTEDIAKNAMDDFISKNSPIPLKDLSYYTKFHKNSKFTYGAIGVPKSWEDKIKNICKNIGIKSCEFFPEPYIMLTLTKNELVEDFTLFSFHKDKVFVSIFHNQILYDSYFLNFNFSEDGQLNCPSCFQEFLTSMDSFENQFGETITNTYFVGFPQKLQKYIDEFIESKGLKCDFINAKDLKNYQLYKTDHDLMTLLGLTDKLLQEN